MRTSLRSPPGSLLPLSLVVGLAFASGAMAAKPEASAAAARPAAPPGAEVAAAKSPGKPASSDDVSRTQDSAPVAQPAVTPPDVAAPASPAESAVPVTEEARASAAPAEQELASAGPAAKEGSADATSNEPSPTANADKAPAPVEDASAGPAPTDDANKGPASKEELTSTAPIIEEASASAGGETRAARNPDPAPVQDTARSAPSGPAAKPGRDKAPRSYAGRRSGNPMVTDDDQQAAARIRAEMQRYLDQVGRQTKGQPLKQASNGTLSQVVPVDFLNYSVARRNADGSVAVMHASNLREVEQALAADHSAPRAMEE